LSWVVKGFFRSYSATDPHKRLAGINGDGKPASHQAKTMPIDIISEKQDYVDAMTLLQMFYLIYTD